MGIRATWARANAVIWRGSISIRRLAYRLAGKEVCCETIAPV
jgi:hypothetical protein